MVHSNRMAVVCFLRFIISIQSEFGRAYVRSGSNPVLSTMSAARPL
jgi:hypothetical protein